MMPRHIYDLTNDTWISDATPSSTSEEARPAGLLAAGRVINTGMTPGSGAAADLWQHPRQWPLHTRVLRECSGPSASSPPPIPRATTPAAGVSWADRVIDGMTVIAGLMVFACIAMFFLLLA